MVSLPFAHLLAQEITNLQGPSTLLNDAVDGEVSVDRTHLVLEALEVDKLSICPYHPGEIDIP